MTLTTYASKRRFGRTPEPTPGLRAGGGAPAFVVHKHAARALHYDLRLEMEGVLKSWAVPKGPSLNPSVKRLAVAVEDHPLDYRDFEGVIPKGNYGAGSVIIWDRGTYSHPAAGDERERAERLRDGLRKGTIKFVLDGEKLRGEFALVKTGRDEKSWLLLKKKDRHATAEDILKRDRSVLSGRTVEEVAADPQKTSREEIRAGLRAALAADDLKDAPVRPMPHGVAPMLATLVREPFDHPDWIFEVKWDGYRAVAEIRTGAVLLYSHNGISFNRRFSPVVDALRTFAFDAVLDGEIVVVDDRGHPVFQMLQEYRKTGGGHLLYYVFDLLHLEGRDLMNVPLLRRKELLKKILPAASKIRFSDHVRGEGVLFFSAAREKGLEGIVAKHARSAYRPGRRSRQWLKVKTKLAQKAVVAGFTEPRGSRRHFGALILGAFRQGELIYIGHTGSGFDTRTLREIRGKMNPLIRKRCPFKAVPETNAEATWVKPALVCEVSHRGWTADGLMRQPSFLRLRDDKTARDAVLEKPAPVAAPRSAP